MYTIMYTNLSIQIYSLKNKVSFSS